MASSYGISSRIHMERMVMQPMRRAAHLQDESQTGDTGDGLPPRYRWFGVGEVGAVKGWA
jgi:hypothetical protein